MARCPNCHKSDLVQQINRKFFNCLNCGYWGELKRRKDLEWEGKDTQKRSGNGS